VESVGFDRGYAAFSVSTNGTLVYRRADGAGATNLQWFDRSGKRLGVIERALNVFMPVLSRDGNRVAVEVRGGGSSDVWVIDVLRETLSRFTFEAAFDGQPMFSPDGQNIVFTSNRDATPGLYLKPATGTGQEELIHKGNQIIASDWSPDGTVLLYNVIDTETGVDIWALPMSGERKPYVVLNQKSNELRPRFSEDGRWFVYASNESGRSQIYVQTFPPSGGKWQVSVEAGSEPVWGRDGKEIFFNAPEGRIMAVDVTLGSTFEAGIPRELFRLPVANTQRFAVTADSRRFLFALPPDSGGGDHPTITVVQNWTADIGK
jgi:Tol biopolymer transport system component